MLCVFDGPTGMAPGYSSCLLDERAGFDAAATSRMIVTHTHYTLNVFTCAVSQ